MGTFVLDLWIRANQIALKLWPGVAKASERAHLGWLR